MRFDPLSRRPSMGAFGLLAVALARSASPVQGIPFRNVFGVCSATVRFSSDGGTLAVANEKTVTLYDLVGRNIRGAYAFPALALTTAFAPDLTRAVSVTSGSVLTWKLGAALPHVRAGEPAARSADP